jgi:hypothetical protein
MQATRQLPARGAQRSQAQPFAPQSTRSRGYRQQAQFPQPVPFSQPAPYQPVQYPQPVQYSQLTQYQQRAVAPPATGGAAFADPRLSTVQLRKHPQTGVETLSYLDRFGKTVFIQRPCGHCATAGTPNAWHFGFSCINKPQGAKRARTYAGNGATDLPGTFESPSGLPTSYTFSGHAGDPDQAENPFCIDDCEESGNGEWDQ